MPQTSDSARPRDAQASQPQPNVEPADVAAFVRLHGLRPCSPRPHSAEPKKPVSARRQRLSMRAYWAVRKGREDCARFKQEHPQLAREQLERLKHFDSI